MRSHIRLTRGFTLVELMVTIAILAIILAIGMPNFATWMENNRLRNATESIVSGLQLARAEAVSRNAQVQFVLETGSAWTVGCATVSTTCPATIQSRSAADGSAASITVEVDDDDDDEDTFVFDGFGRLVSPVLGGGATSLSLDVDSSKLEETESKNLRVTIGTAGAVRSCNPNITATGDPRRC